MFWQIFNSLLAERRVTRIFLWGTNAAEESKDQFLEINILVRALTVQLYKPILVRALTVQLYKPIILFFFSQLQSCINDGCNSHGLVIIFEVKIVFTYEKFSVLAFKTFPKKVTEISNKPFKQVTMVPKCYILKKVSTLPITVLKKYRVNAARYFSSFVVV